MPSAEGPPAFEISDGGLTLQQLLGALPLGDLLVRVVAHYRQLPLNTGQATQAVEGLSRRKPFAKLSVETFLNGYAYEAPAPIPPVEEE
jgi:hypothetical protein